MKTEKTEKTKRMKLERILNGIGLAVCILLLPLMICNATLSIKGLLNPMTPPDFMGYIPMIVGTGSMEPTFSERDLIIDRKPADAAALEEGTIVSYRAGSTYVSHRIVAIEHDSDGKVMYVTQGDANNAADTVRVAPEQIVGVYQTRITGIGSIMLFMQTSVGMIVCVLVPMAILFLYCLYMERRKYKKMLAEKEAQLEASQL